MLRDPLQFSARRNGAPAPPAPERPERAPSTRAARGNYAPARAEMLECGLLRGEDAGGRSAPEPRTGAAPAPRRAHP